ncbi:MAG: Holliday junction branch migration protein RuvA [Actinomycetota bacterium]
MIGRLRGVLAEKADGAVIVDVGGVGYVVAVTPRTLADLPQVGEEAVLHTHMHVREDQLSLFGFDGAADRDLFSLLLGVSGVGPKVGLAILATMTPDQLRMAVVSGDTEALTAVPGIGRRSAEKLMVELRPKMEASLDTSSTSGPMSEVRQALASLGYSPDEIRDTLGAMSQDLSVEELLRRSLQQLGKGRTA